MALQPHRLEFKPHRLEFIFGMVLAMAVTIVASENLRFVRIDGVAHQGSAAR
jgi:hypothetical protein